MAWSAKTQNLRKKVLKEYLTFYISSKPICFTFSVIYTTKWSIKKRKWQYKKRKEITCVFFLLFQDFPQKFHVAYDLNIHNLKTNESFRKHFVFLRKFCVFFVIQKSFLTKLISISWKNHCAGVQKYVLSSTQGFFRYCIERRFCNYIPMYLQSKLKLNLKSAHSCNSRRTCSSFFPFSYFYHAIKTLQFTFSLTLSIHLAYRSLFLRFGNFQAKQVSARIK